MKITGLSLYMTAQAISGSKTMQVLITILAFVSFTLTIVGLADGETLVTITGIVGLVTAFMSEDIAAL